MGIQLQDSDDGLMLKVQNDNDKKAFTELCLRYSQRLNSYFSHKLCQVHQDRTQAGDYTQEVFLRLWLKRDRYKAKGKFSNYLLSIARNYWRNCQRDAHRQPQTVSFEDEFGENPL